MGIIHKRRGARAGRYRATPKKGLAAGEAWRFLRGAFYYLKAEQLLKTSTRLLCEAA